MRPLHQHAPQPGRLVSYTPTRAQAGGAALRPLLATIVRVQRYQGRKTGATGLLQLAVATPTGLHLVAAKYDPLTRRPGTWQRPPQPLPRAPRRFRQVNLQHWRPLITAATPCRYHAGQLLDTPLGAAYVAGRREALPANTLLVHTISLVPLPQA